MRPGSVRTSIDLPHDLHRRLHEAAIRRGCSARQLIVHSIERVVDESTPVRQKRRLSLKRPIVPSRGKPFRWTNEQLYDFLGLP